MSKAFKARLLASTSLPFDQDLAHDLLKTMARIAWRLVIPATFASRKLGCQCIGMNQRLDNCPYHGRAARAVIHG